MDHGAPRISKRDALGLAAATLAAVVARCLAAPLVFTDAGVRLLPDGDPYYHALRSLRIAERWPSVPWFDGWLNFPRGAEIPWPPLMDQLIATVAVATGAADHEHVAAVAAVLPVVAGALTPLLVALLGRTLLGSGVSLGAAFLMAVLPASFSYSLVGRADHHVLELALWLGCCVVYSSALRAPEAGWRRPTALAVLLTLAFWNWTGSALCVLVLGFHAALAYVAAVPGAARAATVLFRASLLTTALLVASVGALGPPGGLGRTSLSGITALPAVLTALVAAFSALLLAAVRRNVAAPAARLALAAVAAALPLSAAGVAAAAFPGAAAGVTSALTAFGRSNPWYRDITEFRPLLFAGQVPLAAELDILLGRFGLVPLLALVGFVPLSRAWRARAEHRSQLLLLGLLAALFLPMAAVRARFDLYALVPLVLLAAWGARHLGDLAAMRSSPRRPALAAAISAAVLALAWAPTARELVADYADPARAELADTLAWLRGRSVPAPGREAVLANWTLGHDVQWFAGKPVLASPFGTEGGAGAMEDYAAFLHTSDPAEVEELLERRRVGFVLLELPVTELGATWSFTPPGTPVAIANVDDVTSGRSYDIRPTFWSLVPTGLYFFDGSGSGGRRRELGAYRLLAESTSDISFASARASTFKLFEVVRGATLAIAGAPPGGGVWARAMVRTNTGRSFAWEAGAVADASGEARLRVPYASGVNGRTSSTPFLVASGGRAATAVVAEPDVLEGRTVSVPLR